MRIPEKCELCDRKADKFFAIVPRGQRGMVMDGEVIDYTIYGECTHHNNIKKDECEEALHTIRQENTVLVFESRKEIEEYFNKEN